MSKPITQWRVGDRAYISADNVMDGPYTNGDIVNVTALLTCGTPLGGDGFELGDYGREPLRILRPGETIPAGAEYLSIDKHSSLEPHKHFSVGNHQVLPHHALFAIKSIPDADAGKQAQLDCIAVIERELAELKKQVKA